MCFVHFCVFRMGNGHIKNEESARVSIPGQIKKYVLLFNNRQRLIKYLAHSIM